MKLTEALILTLSAMVPLMAAAPAAAAVDQDYDISPVNQLFKRDGNFCSPTGPESCNFWMHVSQPGNYFQRWWKLFDNACRRIGEDEYAIPSGWDFSLRSQLPYTIELHIEGNLQPSGHFWYAGRKTDLGGMYCVDCTGFHPSRCCRIAFQCR